MAVILDVHDLLLYILQSGRLSRSGKLGMIKIYYVRHRKKKVGRKMGPLPNGALCLSTPNHNGKSGTVPFKNE
jgi:hypothetical protein